MYVTIFLFFVKYCPFVQLAHFYRLCVLIYYTCYLYDKQWTVLYTIGDLYVQSPDLDRKEKRNAFTNTGRESCTNKLKYMVYAIF